MNPLPIEQRRQRQRAEARRTILDATADLLVEGGLEGFSMRRLAERCGYTAPTIYHHFGDKTGLLQALIEDLFSRLLDELRATPPSDDPVERMRQLCLSFVRFGLRHPRQYQLLTLPRGNATPPPSSEQCIAILEEPMDSLAGQDRLQPGDREANRQSAWALLHGLISIQSGHPDYEWHDKLNENAIDLLVRGLVRPERAVARNGAD